MEIRGRSRAALCCSPIAVFPGFASSEPRQEKCSPPLGASQRRRNPCTELHHRYLLRIHDLMERSDGAGVAAVNGCALRPGVAFPLVRTCEARGGWRPHHDSRAAQRKTNAHPVRKRAYFSPSNDFIDNLPPGFSYVPGSTTGATTARMARTAWAAEIRLVPQVGQGLVSLPTGSAPRRASSVRRLMPALRWS